MSHQAVRAYFECPEFPCEHTGLDENLYQRHVAISRRIAEIGCKAYYDEIKDIPRYEAVISGAAAEV